jgi:TRAP-type C4-dicarboxylate transport system permease small subunit
MALDIILIAACVLLWACHIYMMLTVSETMKYPKWIECFIVANVVGIPFVALPCVALLAAIRIYTALH